MQAICKGEQFPLDRFPEICEATVRAKFVDQRIDQDELATTSSQRTETGCGAVLALQEVLVQNNEPWC